MGRATTGTFQSTPLGIVAAESKMALARPLLDYRRAKFAQRLMARPKRYHGPEKNLERRGTRLTERLRQSAFLWSKVEQEKIEWTRSRRFQGKIRIDSRGKAYQAAKNWSDRRNTIWTDGSRLEDGRVGAAAVWWREAGKEPP